MGCEITHSFCPVFVVAWTSPVPPALCYTLKRKSCDIVFKVDYQEMPNSTEISCHEIPRQVGCDYQPMPTLFLAEPPAA